MSNIIDFADCRRERLRSPSYDLAKPKPDGRRNRPRVTYASYDLIISAPERNLHRDVASNLANARTKLRRHASSKWLCIRTTSCGPSFWRTPSAD